MDIQKLLLKLLSNEGCGVIPQEEISLDARLFDIGFDSLRYMELLVLLEEEMGEELPDFMLEMEVETTVSSLISTLKGCL